MLNNFSLWLTKHVGKKQLIALALLYIIILCVMSFLFIPTICKNTGTMGIFDLQAKGFSLDYAKSFITTMGDDGKSVYLKAQLPLDFIFPAVYTLLYFGLAQKVFKKQYVVVFAATALLCVSDYTENSLTYAMLLADNLSAELVAVASFVTMVKTILLYGTTGMIAAGGLYRLWTNIKNRQHKPKGTQP
jgi:hypothetical protein